MGCYKGWCPQLGIVAKGEDLINVLLYRFQFILTFFSSWDIIQPGNTMSFSWYWVWPNPTYWWAPLPGIVAGGEGLISVLLYRFQFKTKEFSLHSYLPSPGLEDWESEGSEDSRLTLTWKFFGTFFTSLMATHLSWSEFLIAGVRVLPARPMGRWVIYQLFCLLKFGRLESTKKKRKLTSE